MNRKQFLEALKDVIINNSSLEAEPDDAIIFPDVQNVTIDDDSVMVAFSDKSLSIKIGIVRDESSMIRSETEMEKK